MSRLLLVLCVLIGVLALAAAACGLACGGGPGPSTHTAVQGADVDIYGRGLYRNDSTFRAAGNHGTDAVTLGIGVPLLAASALVASRGSLRARMLLLGTLGYFLYVYLTLAVGTAYNDLFLVYVSLFGASLFAFVLCFASVHGDAGGRISTRPPRRGVAAFMFVAAVVTAGVWLIDPVTALLTSEPPALLEHSTTLVTHALDLAVVVPAAFASGVLILRRAPLGYVIAASLLVLAAMLAPMIAAQTAFQLAAGVTFAPGAIIGPIAGFTLVGVGAVSVLLSLLRSVGNRVER